MSLHHSSKNIGIIATLQSCSLFTGISVEDMQKFAELCVVKNLRKGEYLFREGGPSIGFYIVRSGTINLHRLGAGGKEQVIHFFRSGESFAEGTLVLSQGYPANARAVETSVVILLPKKGVLDLLQTRPDLSLKMLGSMSQHLRILVAALEDLTLKDIETRLIHWILKRCPQPLPAHKITIPLTDKKLVLAAELGVRSETLSRTFAKYRDMKIFEVRAKHIDVLKPKKLEEILERNLG